MEQPGYRTRDRRCYSPEGTLIDFEDDQEMCEEELHEVFVL